MRNYALVLFLLVPVSLLALTRTSIANGLWTNPAIWSPAGVPSAGENIFINTAVIFNQNITLTSAPDTTILYISVGASLVDVAADTLTFDGSLFINHGYVITSVFIGNADSISNYGTWESVDFLQSGFCYNYSPGVICVTNQLVTNDYIYNYGSIKTGTWDNSGWAAGYNGGRICVAGDFVNSDNVFGTLDICDATPGNPGDINTGMIAGTVTFCQAGPCTQCLLPGYPEFERPSIATITPHPVMSTSLFEFESTGQNPSSQNVMTITDISGRTVKSISFSGTSVTFDRTGIESGLYFFQIENSNQIFVQGKLMIE